MGTLSFHMLTLSLEVILNVRLVSPRYCLVQPRYPWYEDGQIGLSMSQGIPTFSLVCYKAASEAKPVTVVPLENARLVVETGVVTEAGVLVSRVLSNSEPSNEELLRLLGESDERALYTSSSHTQAEGWGGGPSVCAVLE